MSAWPRSSSPGAAAGADRVARVNRFHAEFNVAALLAPFLLAAPDYEVQLLLATQVADEHRHIESVLRVYSDVFAVEGGIAAVKALADAHRIRTDSPLPLPLLLGRIEDPGDRYVAFPNDIDVEDLARALEVFRVSARAAERELNLYVLLANFRADASTGSAVRSSGVSLNERVVAGRPGDGDRPHLDPSTKGERSR